MRFFLNGRLYNITIPFDHSEPNYIQTLINNEKPSRRWCAVDLFNYLCFVSVMFATNLINASVGIQNIIFQIDFIMM